MKHSLALHLLGLGLSVCVTSSLVAQPVTTIITHGFQIGAKGQWVQGMADAILARAGQGTIYRYDFSETGGDWQFVETIDGTTEVVVLIFNWTDESDGVNQWPPNWGYTQAAGDVLYAALRDPGYIGPNGPADLLTDRTIHFIGHSRGASVNSEVVRRLALANPPFPVDHITTVDPHPVNGSFPNDAPFNFNWGDSVPQKWDNVTWADNYWRNDADPFDFDGMPIENVMDVQLDEDALECAEVTICLGFPDFFCGYLVSHSDVHLWYHGTVDTAQNPDDGEECISDLMRDTWWWDGYHWTDHGYYYSDLGGGSADRPGPQPDGVPPTEVPLLYNGTFDQGSYAGWRYHGGAGGSVDPAGFLTLQFGIDQSYARHNRFFLPATAQTLNFWYEVSNTSDDDTLQILLTNLGSGTEFLLGEIPLDEANGWLPESLDIPPNVPRAEAYTLTFRIDYGFIVKSTVHIDDVVITELQPDNIHFVPTEFPTIQAAIDFATDGDEVVVAPGTYFELIDFLGKAITVRSSGGQDVTTIDAQGTGSVVKCTSGEGPDTMLKGFTITGGSATWGGGMFNLNGSSPTVTNCTFTGNSAAEWGGGMFIFGETSATITNCTFTKNTADLGGGFFYSAAFLTSNINVGPPQGPVLANCTFTANTAVVGGGMLSGWGTVTLSTCAFLGNTATESGGGLWWDGGNGFAPGTVEDCTFVANTAPYGGGLATDQITGEWSIIGCNFEGNLATVNGGGIYNFGNAAPFIAQSNFCENTPDHIFGDWTDDGGNCFADTCDDANGNGIPDHCDADLDGDGSVGVKDLLILLGNWGPCGDCNDCPADLDSDCSVGVKDLLILLGNWG